MSWKGHYCLSMIHSPKESLLYWVFLMKSELKSMVLAPGVKLREATTKPWLMFKDHRRVGVNGWQCFPNFTPIVSIF